MEIRILVYNTICIADELQNNTKQMLSGTDGCLFLMEGVVLVPRNESFTNITESEKVEGNNL